MAAELVDSLSFKIQKVQTLAREGLYEPFGIDDVHNDVKFRDLNIEKVYTSFEQKLKYNLRRSFSILEDTSTNGKINVAQEEEVDDTAATEEAEEMEENTMENRSINQIEVNTLKMQLKRDVTLQLGDNAWLEARKSFDLLWIRKMLENRRQWEVLKDPKLNSSMKNVLKQSHEQLHYFSHEKSRSMDCCTKSISGQCEFNSSLGSLTMLPNEVIYLILMRLGLKDLSNFRLVSKYCEVLGSEDMIWETVIPKSLNDKKYKNWVGSTLLHQPSKDKMLRSGSFQENKIPSYTISGLLDWYFVGNPDAREFWKTYFVTEDGIQWDVPWLTFAKAYYNFLETKRFKELDLLTYGKKGKQQLTDEKPIQLRDATTGINKKKKKHHSAQEQNEKKILFTVDDLENGDLDFFSENPQPLEEYRAMKTIFLTYQCTSKRANMIYRGSGSVSIETLCSVLEWFGPFMNLLRRIIISLKFVAFHGFSTSDEIKTLLKGCPKGTFAFRFSESLPGCFVMTRVVSAADQGKQEKISESRLFWDRKKGFTAGKYSARTLNRFCRALRELGLVYIRPSSLFSSIWLPCPVPINAFQTLDTMPY